MTEPIAFKRHAVAPFRCIAESFRRIRNQYWLLVAIVLVGSLLGGAAPLALLLGPMMCGMYGCFRDKLQGRTVQFEGIFGGFESGVLLPSIVATLLLVVCVVALLVPFAILGAIAAIGGAATVASHHEDTGPPIVLIVVAVAFFIFWMAVIMIVGLLFGFTYPLIVDRRLDAIEAIKLSARATLANFWGMLGLTLTSMALGICGLCACYVGAFLVSPISFGALMVAYESVFGFTDRPSTGPAHPPSGAAV